MSLAKSLGKLKKRKDNVKKLAAVAEDDSSDDVMYGAPSGSSVYADAEDYEGEFGSDDDQLNSDEEGEDLDPFQDMPYEDEENDADNDHEDLGLANPVTGYKSSFVRMEQIDKADLFSNPQFNSSRKYGLFDIEELSPDISVKKFKMETNDLEADDEAADQKKKKKKKKDKKKKKEPEEQGSKKEEVKEELHAELPESSEWNAMNLHPSLTANLARMKFFQPTQIQKEGIPVALKQCDVVGAAETGSGKTLAFGIPIIHKLLSKAVFDPNQIYALILSPTRELAIQISNHLTEMCKETPIKVAPIVGGLSRVKQNRILSKKKPNIVVATPGRLWDWMEKDRETKSIREFQEMKAHPKVDEKPDEKPEGKQANKKQPKIDTLCDVSKIEFLVLDEADRMVETGHYKELTQILSLLPRKKAIKEGAALRLKSDRPIVKFQENDGPTRQTLVFSATLLSEKTSTTFRELIKKLQFQNKIQSIDVTDHSHGVAHSITEVKVNCLPENKDQYLYYFLCQYPGRTLIFCNAISTVKRLTPLLKILGLPVYPLHGEQQQRARLKYLDKLKNNPNAILVTTDVTARGLDIPQVDYVVHYQIPRNSEWYVHRSGRTGRANSQGLSLIMCCADEMTQFEKIFGGGSSAQKSGTQLKKSMIENFPVDKSIFPQVKQRLKLALDIDQLEHHMNKKKSKNWLHKLAEEAEIDYDQKCDSDEEFHNKNKRRAIHQLRSQLTEMLQTPLFPSGTPFKYITPEAHAKIVHLQAPKSALEVVQQKKAAKKV